jgi:hypothetical protein
MKNLVILVGTFCLLCSFISKDKIFIETIQVGNFKYNIYKEHKYTFKESMDCDYFVVYNDDNKRLCSGYISGKHKGILDITGCYLYSAKKFVTKTYYNHHTNLMKSTDSNISTFYPNKNGDLILINSKEFKGGKFIEHKY